MLYRDHKGGSTVKVDSEAELIAHLTKASNAEVETVKFRPVDEDKRSEWRIWNVLAQFKGRNKYYVVGMSDAKDFTNQPEELLPVGTRIVFTKTLTAGATGDHPSYLYAKKGQKGEVTGHGCWEGHMVKTHDWPHPFGAQRWVEFVEDK